MRRLTTRARAKVQALRADQGTGATARFGRSIWAEARARGRAQVQGRRAGIEIGRRVRFGRHVRIDAPDGSRVVMGDDVQISDFVVLEVQSGGLISLGNGVILGRGNVIAAQRHVSLGHECGTAEWTSIRDHDHDPTSAAMSMQVLQADVRVGERVHIGARVAIVRGVTIGDDAFIAANAVVNRPVPPACLAAGVPARVVRRDLRGPPE